MRVDWKSDESVVQAAVPDAALQGVSGTSASRVYSKTEGPMSDWLDGASWFVLAERGWKAARRCPKVVAYEALHRPKAVAQPLCANCSQPIQRCGTWGWHHVDGPVLCYNESELEATPRPEDREPEPAAKPIAPASGFEDRLAACEAAWKETGGIFKTLGEQNAFRLAFDLAWNAALSVRSLPVSE